MTSLRPEPRLTGKCPSPQPKRPTRHFPNLRLPAFLVPPTLSPVGFPLALLTPSLMQPAVLPPTLLPLAFRMFARLLPAILLPDLQPRAFLTPTLQLPSLLPPYLNLAALLSPAFLTLADLLAPLFRPLFYRLTYFWDHPPKPNARIPDHGLPSFPATAFRKEPAMTSLRPEPRLTGKCPSPQPKRPTRHFPNLRLTGLLPCNVLQPALLSLALFLGFMTPSGPALADPSHHFQSGDRWRHHASPPTYGYGRHERFFEHHHRPHYNPYYPRCRTVQVPYWDAYWGVWSQRIERICS